jgi:hypothetical protein
MCPISATTLVIAAGAVSAVGAAVGAIGQSNADKYNSQVAAQNAVVAQQQAQAAAKVQRENAIRAIGATVVAYGASGVRMEGTPLDVLADSASNAERDRQNILYQGQIRAAGYQNQSQLDSMGSSNDLIEGGLKATGMLLGTAGQVKAMDGDGFASLVPGTATWIPGRNGFPG